MKKWMLQPVRRCTAGELLGAPYLAKLHLPDGAVYETGDGEAVAESWDGQTVKGIVVKSSDERRYTLTVGYPADQPDVAVARDGHLDFANEVEVEKAAWAFMQNPQVGLYHEDGTEGAGRIVESYVYRGPDWTIEAADNSTRVVKSGTWLIGTIWDEPAYELFKSGKLRGTSMQGSAKRRAPSPADIARVVSKRG